MDVVLGVKLSFRLPSWRTKHPELDKNDEPVRVNGVLVTYWTTHWRVSELGVEVFPAWLTGPPYVGGALFRVGWWEGMRFDFLWIGALLEWLAVKERSK